MHAALALVAAATLLEPTQAAPNAPATDGTSVRVLTLEDAVAAAKGKNFDLGAARARLDQAKVGVEQAWDALLPLAAAQGRYTHNYKEVALRFSEFNAGTLTLAQILEQANSSAPAGSQNPALGPALRQFATSLAQNAGVAVIQKQEQLDAGLNLSVPIIVPSTYFAIAAAQQQFVASQASFRVTEDNLLYAVAQAFFAAAGSDELLVARKHAALVAEQTLKNTQAALAAGTAKRTDVDQAELSWRQAQQAVLEANDGRDRAYRSLATLTQIRAPFRIEAALPAPRLDSIEGLVDEAFAQRPDLRAYRAGIAAARARKTSAFLRWAPSLSGFGRAAVQNYQGFSGDYYSWAVGLTLDWTLYDAGQRDAAQHLADAQIDEAENQIESVSSTIRDDVKNAVDTINTKRAAVETAKQQLALAGRTLDLTREQFAAGVSQQLEVLRAQDALVGAEVSLAQARFDLAIALLSLEHTVGRVPAGG